MQSVKHNENVRHGAGAPDRITQSVTDLLRDLSERVTGLHNDVTELLGTHLRVDVPSSSMPIRPIVTIPNVVNSNTIDHIFSLIEFPTPYWSFMNEGTGSASTLLSTIESFEGEHFVQSHFGKYLQIRNDEVVSAGERKKIKLAFFTETRLYTLQDVTSGQYLGIVLYRVLVSPVPTPLLNCFVIRRLDNPDKVSIFHPASGKYMGTREGDIGATTLVNEVGDFERWTLLKA